MNVDISGINIQYPWSKYLVEGKKTIETRTYAIPMKYLGRPLAIVETAGKFKKDVPETRIIGIVIFKECWRYENIENWKKDKKYHLVEETDSLYGWNENKEKWAWLVESIVKFEFPIPPPKSRGIVYVSNCQVPQKYLEKMT